MSREDMLDVRETSLTHAMTFQGAELDDAGKPVAWRVENSWGKDSCKDGYLYMSADWFRHLWRRRDGHAQVRPRRRPRAVGQGGLQLDVEPWDGVAAGLGVRS